MFLDLEWNWNILDYSIAGKYENTTIQIKFFNYFTNLVQYKLSLSYFMLQELMLCLTVSIKKVI